MDLSWVAVESFLVSVKDKDTPKCDDRMFSELNVNVKEFMEIIKKVFLQYNAKSYNQDTALNSTSCVSIAVTPTLF